MCGRRVFSLPRRSLLHRPYFAARTGNTRSGTDGVPWRFHSRIRKARLHRAIRKGEPTPYPLQAWLFGSGGNMVFRKHALRQIGGFDEFMAVGEDLDVFYRILRAGHALVYSPGAVVMHSHVREHRRLRKRLYRWGTAYLTFLSKAAIEDPRYRATALREMRNWFRFQLWQRFGELSSGFPPDLYAAELLGGLSGASTSWFRYYRHNRALGSTLSAKQRNKQDGTKGATQRPRTTRQLRRQVDGRARQNQSEHRQL
ncbi:glycosyltransferase family 2 protein [Proteobacteria bacterium 005FR1]|nr:glycosyltransferase family 2 protein [Proteobacteria bacterium 005FR1]